MTNPQPPSKVLPPRDANRARLFTLEDLEGALLWIKKLRKDYSANNDIWNLCRAWESLKYKFLEQLNDGSYQFSALDRIEFDDGTISLWSSQDMIALKLIASALGERMAPHLPQSCYHVKGHGGLKAAVAATHTALPAYYYESIHFGTLMGILETYISSPVLLTLISKVCRRSETCGGHYYDYHERSIPKGSPLSPLLGAIALIPLDKAMENTLGVFYLRFMDDWVVLTKTKTALRKVMKRTHQIMANLKLTLHPLKTFLGKISHGFNFLAYYFDHTKILPSKETIRRFHERVAARYAQPQKKTKTARQLKKLEPRRDISEYPAGEAAPNDAEAATLLRYLRACPPDTYLRMRQYLDGWLRWLKSGLFVILDLEACLRDLLPSLFSRENEVATHEYALAIVSPI